MKGVNELDNGVYFKNFTPAVVNGTEKNGKSGKRFYEEYLNTGKGTGYYYKLISTYQEYLEFKAIQPDIIEMDETYFTEYFMMVTAPYNSSFIGTGIEEDFHQIIRRAFDIKWVNKPGREYKRGKIFGLLRIPYALDSNIYKFATL